MISLLPEELILPDRWAIIRIRDVYKILSGFYGDYLGSDYWRLNSGIRSIEGREDSYYVLGYSGSGYNLYHDKEGFTSTSWAYFSSLKEKYPDDIEQVTIQDVVLCEKTTM